MTVETNVEEATYRIMAKIAERCKDMTDVEAGVYLARFINSIQRLPERTLN